MKRLIVILIKYVIIIRLLWSKLLFYKTNVYIFFKFWKYKKNWNY